MKGTSRLAIAGALAIVYVVWGSTYLGIAVAIETLPPLLMAATRFVVAGALLYLIAGGLRTRPSRRDWGLAALTGSLLLLIGNGGVVWAQQTVASGIAALLIATVPLWIVVLDRLLFGKRLSRQAVLGVVLGFGGVAILVDPTGDVDVAGAVVLLIAAVGWATGSLLSREPIVPERPLVGAAMQMLAGGAALVVTGVAFGEAGDVRPSEFSLASLAAVGYLVVFGSLVAFSAYVWLLRTARTSLVATYAYVNPVVAVFLGWSFLEEALTGRIAVAGGIIVAAVALIVSAGRVRAGAEAASTQARAGRAGARRPAGGTAALPAAPGARRR